MVARGCGIPRTPGIEAGIDFAPRRGRGEGAVGSPAWSNCSHPVPRTPAGVRVRLGVISRGRPACAGHPWLPSPHPAGMRNAGRASSTSRIVCSGGRNSCPKTVPATGQVSRFPHPWCLCALVRNLFRSTPKARFREQISPPLRGVRDDRLLFGGWRNGPPRPAGSPSTTAELGRRHPGGMTGR